MTIKQYPSNEFPALPEILIETIDGWEDVTLPDSVLAVKKPKADHEFSPNILINAYKTFDSWNFEYNKKEVLDYTKNLAELSIFNNSVKVIDKKEWQVIEYMFKHESGDILAQLMATTQIDVASSKFVVRFTATAAVQEDSPNEDYKEIQDTLRTIKVGGK